ncbi:tripartite tricarboxylate transporter substrate binding protein [Achromobacter insolitus]|uniref:tripartite tricarboxylate transporter substrate binding protein n=1 Tax=Achromobacter insolitus TaxID=217204 RepID=UPI0011EB8B1B|nr:tripartite tricarboxylate transporter substrate binding protein [Achromobacter insolitus]QEK94652.1 tripartite tricarboxylate transporter substrate binding protein [Achromobacter insolitus]
MMKQRWRSAIAAAALCAAAGAAWGQGYPDRPVRLIVPFPPGGSVDYVARNIAPVLSQKLGQTVVVDNKGGASGTIGTAELARAPADGYTLMLAFDSHAVNSSLYKNLSYDTIKSFDYISLIGTMPAVLLTAKKTGITTLQQFLDYAHAHPGQLNYGSSGVGGSNHLNLAALAARTDIKLTHVPYRGGGPMFNAVLGGEVDVVIASLPTIVGFVQGGRLNALAIGTAQPAPALPDVPPIATLVPGFEAYSWVGMLAPAGLPAEVRKRVQQALSDTLATPQVRDSMEQGGFNIVSSSPEQFQQRVQAESQRWGKLIRDTGIKIE